MWLIIVGVYVYLMVALLFVGFVSQAIASSWRRKKGNGLWNVFAGIILMIVCSLWPVFVVPFLFYGLGYTIAEVTEERQKATGRNQNG